MPGTSYALPTRGHDRPACPQFTCPGPFLQAGDKVNKGGLPSRLDRRVQTEFPSATSEARRHRGVHRARPGAEIACTCLHGEFRGASPWNCRGAYVFGVKSRFERIACAGSPHPGVAHSASNLRLRDLIC